MLYKSSMKKMCKNLLFGGLLCVMGFTTFSCSDENNLDDKQPTGSRTETIYSYMDKQGNFKYFLQLTKDLGYDEVLSKTGSKTLFPAPDEAFEDFFKDNDWGVGSYDDLTLAQKRLLLNSAIIDNPYSITMLSTAQGPVKGEVCRRMSSLSLYDSVQVVSTSSEELPQTPYWAVLKNHPEIVLFKDASGASPMVHFTQKFLTTNMVLSSDVDFLYNDPVGTRQPGEAYIGDAKITASEDCKNGYVHVVDKVITPLDNMAEIIRKNDNMSIFSSMLERYAVPYYDRNLTMSYNQNKGTEVDSVFVKRYFSKRSNGSTTTQDRAFNKDKEGNDISGTALKYDPGWNTYIPTTPNPRDPLMEDMAVMLVPTDDAINEWWNNGGGKVIKDYYGSLEETPNDVLIDLLNVNMLESLTGSVPSRFETVLDDANQPMNIQPGDVDKVFLGCNGAVFQTNRVFAPASYSSVLFPAVVNNETMNIIRTAIKVLDYEPYLNSMVSTYSFFIPTNDGMLTYIDPGTYGNLSKGEKVQLWEFHYDNTKVEKEAIYVDIYNAVQNSDGTWSKDGEVQEQIKGDVTGSSEKLPVLRNRLEDILDNIIGVEEAYAGKEYVITKGKNFVKLGGTYGVAGSMTASGSWQNENNAPCVVKEIYNMQNGKAYIVDGVLTGTRKAASDLLADVPEFSEFFQIMSNCDMLGIKTDENYVSASQNLGTDARGNLITIGLNSSKQEANYSLLNAFHYTIYVPTNDAMQKAYAKGLPTLQELIDAEAYDEANGLDGELATALPIKSVMRDFVRYHIQNNSIYLDNGFATGVYESLKNKMEPQLDENGNLQYNSKGELLCMSGSPYRIKVSAVDPSAMTLRDAMHNTVHVVTTKSTTGNWMYNLQGREYWFKSDNTLVNSSSLVVQAIDSPLFYDDDQFTYVPRAIIDDSSVKQRR